MRCLAATMLAMSVFLPSIAWSQTKCMAWVQYAEQVGRYRDQPEIVTSYQKASLTPEDYALLMKMAGDVKADKFFNIITTRKLAENYCGWPDTLARLAAEKAKVVAWLDQMNKVNHPPSSR